MGTKRAVHAKADARAPPKWSGITASKIVKFFQRLRPNNSTMVAALFSLFVNQDKLENYYVD